MVTEHLILVLKINNYYHFSLHCLDTYIYCSYPHHINYTNLVYIAIKKEYHLYTSLTTSNTNSILIQDILINVSRKLFHGIIITLSIRFYKAINK